MALYQLIYISELATDESVLASIHSHAVRNNTARTVTGMLIYANHRFLQMLEGERKDVLHTFERIQDDPRHRHVHVIAQTNIEERLFSHWNMGFKQFNAETLAEHPDLHTFFARDLEACASDAEAALQLFRQFA